MGTRTPCEGNGRLSVLVSLEGKAIFQTHIWKHGLFEVIDKFSSKLDFIVSETHSSWKVGAIDQHSVARYRRASGTPLTCQSAGHPSLILLHSQWEHRPSGDDDTFTSLVIDVVDVRSISLKVNEWDVRSTPVQTIMTRSPPTHSGAGHQGSVFVDPYASLLLMILTLFLKGCASRLDEELTAAEDMAGKRFALIFMWTAMPTGATSLVPAASWNFFK
jgi:hypothetical protein